MTTNIDTTFSNELLEEAKQAPQRLLPVKNYLETKMETKLTSQ